MKQKGITLIELVLYITIFSIVITSFTPMLINIMKTTQKSSIQQDVISSADYISQKLTDEIRGASNINATTSFGVNLASSSAVLLSIQKPADANPYIFRIINGRLQLTRGLATPVYLNPTNTSISNFVLTDNSAGDLSSRNITYTFTIGNLPAVSRSAFMYSTTRTSSIELRVH